MGYYTTYILNVEMDTVDPVQRESLQENIRRTSDYYHLFRDYKLGYSFETEPIKWYGHDSDMLKLSSMYPSVEFILEGHGEERADIWRKYYKNGKVKRVEPEVVWPNREELEKMEWT